MTVEFLTGDVRMMLDLLPDASVQCCVTSPPYYGLRDYGVAGQIGLEPTPDEYVAEMVAVFREVRRVLRDDGTLWLNIGDSYAAGGMGPGSGKQLTNVGANIPAKKAPPGYKAKDLLGTPWLLAFALRADGWYLRSDIIWHKPNPMPESTKDRPTSAHEHVFLLAKRPSYFYDAEAIKEEAVTPAGTRGAKGSAARAAVAGVNSRPPEYAVYDGTRNIRNVWTIQTRPFRGAHFATMPPELAERCVRAGTSERGCCPACGAGWVRIVETEYKHHERWFGDKQAARNSRGVAGNSYNEPIAKRTVGWQPTCACPAHEPVPATVLDPFGGAGTTGLVAQQLGRKAILVELNPEYVTLARARLGLAPADADIEDMLA